MTEFWLWQTDVVPKIAPAFDGNGLTVIAISLEKPLQLPFNTYSL